MRQGIFIFTIAFLGVAMAAAQTAQAPATPATGAQTATAPGAQNQAPRAAASPSVTLSDTVMTPPPAQPRVVTPPTIDYSSSAQTIPANNAANSGAQNATTPQVPNLNANPRSKARITELGIANFSSAWTIGDGGGSVAEASARHKRQKTTLHSRLYTNDDIARLRQASGEAASAPVTNESTMPSSDLQNDADLPQAAPANNNPPRRSPFRPKPSR